MNQIISFEKDIVFKNNVAVINSISLEHNEKIINYLSCAYCFSHKL